MKQPVRSSTRVVCSPNTVKRVLMAERLHRSLGID
jgi:hypothetical protein